MKKLLLASAILFSGIAFTSCSDDDDVIVTEQNELVGTWKAEFLTYQFGGHGGTYPYDHEIFKQGCATDYLTINSDQTAVLVENNRVDEDCIDELKDGTWTDQTITLSGGDVRTISSVNSDTLVLVYPLSMMGATVDVTVEYSRQ
mgnify:FL=1